MLIKSIELTLKYDAGWTWRQGRLEFCHNTLRKLFCLPLRDSNYPDNEEESTKITLEIHDQPAAQRIAMQLKSDGDVEVVEEVPRDLFPYLMLMNTTWALRNFKKDTTYYVGVMIDA